MATNQKSLMFGRIQVSIIKGDLTTEQGDVIVCAAHKSLDLSKGRASSALREVAGGEIQKECHQNYPEGLVNGSVAVVSGGNLKCKHVFLIALPVWTSGGQERKSLDTLLTNCLREADRLRARSVMLPALGTGYLRYPVNVVAQTTLNCIEQFSSTKPSCSIRAVTIVVFSKDSESFETFTSEARKMSSGGDTESIFDKLMSLSVVSSDPVTESARSRSATQMIGQIEVQIVAGNVADIQADVIVNSTNSNLALTNGGLSESILNQAGEGLQKECRKNYPRGIKPGELAVTKGYDLSAKWVYHATLPDWKPWQPDIGTKALQEFVTTCLDQVSCDEVASIAFPAVGIGSVGYPANIAAQTLFECVSQFQKDYNNITLQKVIVVIYDKAKDWRIDKKIFEEELGGMSEDTDDPDGATGGVSPPNLSPLIQPGMPIFPKAFEMDQKPRQVMKKSFKMSSAMALPPRGTKEFYKEMYKRDLHTPPYWTIFHSHRSLKEWHSDCDEISPLAVPVDADTFVHVRKIVESTWKSQLVGHGRDAQGLGSLGYRNISVTFVERIENSWLYEKYAQKRQELFQKAAKKGSFPPLQGIQGSKGGVETTLSTPPNSSLTTDIYPEINEHYMFHGTQEDVIDTIVEQGLDCRLAGTGAMFGGGIYCAESATKSDQYSDTNKRSMDGQKKMLLIRVCLGEMFLCDQPKTFLRAPCKQCKEDRCRCRNIELYDSVVGDGQWNFREFVVYDRTQVYPEYVITYQRI